MRVQLRNRVGIIYYLPAIAQAVDHLARGFAVKASWQGLHRGSRIILYADGTWVYRTCRDLRSSQNPEGGSDPGPSPSPPESSPLPRPGPA